MAAKFLHGKSIVPTVAFVGNLQLIVYNFVCEEQLLRYKTAEIVSGTYIRIYPLLRVEFFKKVITECTSQHHHRMWWKMWCFCICYLSKLRRRRFFGSFCSAPDVAHITLDEDGWFCWVARKIVGSLEQVSVVLAREPLSLIKIRLLWKAFGTDLIGPLVNGTPLSIYSCGLQLCLL